MHEQSSSGSGGVPVLPVPSRSPESMVGRQLGPFSLIDVLGKGGFCTVFRVRHEWLGVVFALKVLMAPRSGAALERFRNEAKLGLRLRHPNIATVCMAGVDELDGCSFPWMAADMVEGLTVTRLMHRSNGVMNEHAAVRIIMQVLRGLAYVHEAGYAHSDVKPANIVVKRDGQAQLVDFGLAARLAHQRNHAVGTMGFIAPEHWVPTFTVHPRSDLYSVGATLWAMLSGRLPRPKTCGPCPLESLPIDPALQIVLGRLIAERPQDRYGTADEAHAALASWLGDNPGVVGWALALGKQDET